MKKNLLPILISIVAFYWGIEVIIEPVWYDTKYMAKIDVSDFKWFLGIGFILFGFVMLFSEFRPKKDKNDNDQK